MARVLDACCLRCKVVFAKSLTEWPFSPNATTGWMHSCGPGCQGRPKHFFQTGRVLPAVRCPGGVLARKLSRKFITDCPVMSCTGRFVPPPCRCFDVKVLGTQFHGQVHEPFVPACQQPQLQGMCCTVGCFDLTVFVCRDRRLLSASENRA